MFVVTDDTTVSTAAQYLADQLGLDLAQLSLVEEVIARMYGTGYNEGFEDGAGGDPYGNRRG